MTYMHVITQMTTKDTWMGLNGDPVLAIMLGILEASKLVLEEKSDGAHIGVLL